MSEACYWTLSKPPPILFGSGIQDRWSSPAAASPVLHGRRKRLPLPCCLCSSCCSSAVQFPLLSWKCTVASFAVGICWNCQASFFQFGLCFCPGIRTFHLFLNSLSFLLGQATISPPPSYSKLHPLISVSVWIPDKTSGFAIHWIFVACESRAVTTSCGVSALDRK